MVEAKRTRGAPSDHQCTEIFLGVSRAQSYNIRRQSPKSLSQVQIDWLEAMPSEEAVERWVVVELEKMQWWECWSKWARPHFGAGS